MGNNVNQPAFAPTFQGSVSLTATTTTGNVQVHSQFGAMHVRIVNTGAVTVFVEFGTSTVVAATATGMPVVAGATEIFRCPDGYVAAIAASGTAVVYITPGEGL